MTIPQKKPRVIIVQETGEGRFTEELIMGDHVLTADEPTQYGGLNKGPSPYEFLLAALGSCTCMTIRMYSNLKNIPLEKITVTLTYDKIHKDDCIDCENKDAKIDHIERKIELKGQLTEEQRTRLLEIADMCPVHRTLTSKIIINTMG